MTDLNEIPGGFDAPPASVSGGSTGAAAAGNLNLPSFTKALGNIPPGAIDLLKDVDLNVKIELGRTKMLIEDVLKLAEGSVVELDKLAGDPVDIFVNDQLVARGEVLVLNENFCVRINEIITTTDE
jgi:flagellar motor switch protein FliN/FliY